MTDNVHQLYPGPDADTPPQRSAQGSPELAPAGQPPQDPPMSEDRLRRLEDGIRDLKSFTDGFRTLPQLALAAIGMVLAAVALLVTVAIFTLNGVNSQIRDVGARVDALPKLLTEEFRAMRTETAAQTSAIANSITAARQVQPQILIVPAQPPAPASPSTSPSRDK